MDGPMKVDIRSEQVKKFFGGTIYRLHISVKMSERDKSALKASGLWLHALFTYTYLKTGERDDFLNANLFSTAYVDFANMQELDRAKEELLEGLHALRSRLDQQIEHAQEQKRGGTKESYEI